MPRNRTPTTPETPRQAKTWEIVKQRYLRARLCLACAAQCAWGHQLGFAVINQPCDPCREVELPLWLLEKHGDRAMRWQKEIPETLF